MFYLAKLKCLIYSIFDLEDLYWIEKYAVDKTMTMFPLTRLHYYIFGSNKFKYFDFINLSFILTSIYHCMKYIFKEIIGIVKDFESKFQTEIYVKVPLRPKSYRIFGVCEQYSSKTKSGIKPCRKLKLY